MIQEGVQTDVHPALNETFIYFWMNLFGDSPVAVRFPYVIFSIFFLYFAYKFVCELHNKAVALASVTVLSLTQLFVIYGQLARPYAIGSLILMLFSYCWIKLIKEPSRKWMLLTAVFAALGAMTHYFLALSILLIFLVGFPMIKRDRKAWLDYLLAGVLSLLIFSPHLKISLHQFGRKGLGWLPPPQENFLWEFFQYSLNDSIILVCIIFAAPIVGIWSSKGKMPSWKSFPIALIFLISFLVGYYYSIKVDPVLQFSALFFSFPFFIIFLFSFFQEETGIFRFYSIGLLLFVLGTLFLDAQILGPKPFGNFRDVANHLMDWKEEKGDDLLVFSNSNSVDYIDYFYRQSGTDLQEEIDLFEDFAQLRKASELIEKSSANFIALGFANLPIPEEVYELARLKYPRVIEHHRYFNSDVLLLGSSLTDSDEKRTSSFFSQAQLGNDQWSIGEHLIEDSLYFSQPSGFKISESDEFALTYRSKVEDVFGEKPDWINISAKLRSEDSCKIKLVVAIDREGENIDWRGFDVKHYYQKSSWYQMLFVYQLPLNVLPTDDLLIYFWNPEKSSTLIDNVEIVNYEDANFDYYQLK